MSPAQSSSRVSGRRQALFFGIKTSLAALAGQPAAPTGDAMRYGKRSDQLLEVCGLEPGGHDDALHAVLMLAGHECDLVLTLRYADLRIGVFMPNAVVRLFDEDPTDTLGIVLAAPFHDGTNSRCVRLARRGFDCYPRLNEPGWPHIALKPFSHGLMTEFCYTGTPLGEAFDKALCGTIDAAVASEAVAMQTVHVLRALAAQIYSADMRQRGARGLVQRLEFSHRSTSDELVRHYGLEPGSLEIIQEALDGTPGRYAIYVESNAPDDLMEKIAEVRESSVDFDALPSRLY